MVSRAIARAAGLSLALAVLLVLPATAQIGPFAIGLKAGTLGLGAEASVHLAGPLVLRGNLTSYTINHTIEGDNPTDPDFKLKGKLAGTGLIADLHPTKGAFRISAGFYFKTPSATLDAPNTGTVSIGDDNTKHDYNSTQVSALHGAIGGKKTAPYLGLGFDKAVFTKGRIALGFEFGVVMWGEPTPTLTATTTLTGAQKTQLDTDLNAQVQKLKDDIHDAPASAKYFPLLGFSLKVRM